ncbi:30S ribosomal protein S17 [Candidatus Kinetoplastibacterium sorsogonicusi]|uniref:Small ribosomal subunit protein uS17 n=1 Tax=Candidatus Kinetoplastidibacterium kentomonadis TaxID=1576550 RepID=A0A3S7JAT9_9PROT|nr:30S ribosomal protein S17 [Candidatus Kinetoplastibacterium sorsogonicusi]AWD32788.1 30S ribosomal protein S17 [Candidatus Kinetoplastibacterium sorsogonicusi]
MTDNSKKENSNLIKTKRTLSGKVISNKMNKSVVVEIERKVKHKTLGKFVKSSAKYKAHDEKNQYNEGDIVEIMECRPISRTKSWVVVRLLEAVKVI